MLIHHQRDDIDDACLDQIERQYAAKHESQLVVNDRKYGISHRNYGIQRYIVKPYIERDDEQIIGKSRRNAHKDGRNDHRTDSITFRLVSLIDESCRHHVDRGNDESCKFSHESGGSGLEQEFHHYLDQFDEERRDRTECERTDQARQIGQIHLVEAGSYRDRKIKQHQHGTQHAEYRDHRDVFYSQYFLQNKKTSLILTLTVAT